MEPLQTKLQQIRQLIESGQLKTESDVHVCAHCGGTGFEFVAASSAVCKCRCRIAALVAERLAVIPPRYDGVTLEGLQPRADLHAKQSLAIELLKTVPTESFVFCGAAGTGKTHLMYGLYSHIAHDPNRRIVACSMLQLINEYREAFRSLLDGSASLVQPRVRPNDLMQTHTPYTLFFDDIDKPKITEYVAEQVHALFDAAYINKHQIVVTTNLSPDRLVEHFERGDERYGRAIVRRIIHSDNNLIELF